MNTRPLAYFNGFAPDGSKYVFGQALASALKRSDRAKLRLEQAKVEACLRWFLTYCDWPAPTAEQLRKHAKRFGAESVQEIAQAYGVSVDKSVAAKLSNRRRTNRQLRGWVVDLAKGGMLFGAIASTCNVSPARVKEILKAEGFEIPRGSKSLPEAA